jgi:ankyrin repeat protein
MGSGRLDVTRTMNLPSVRDLQKVLRTHLVGVSLRSCFLSVALLLFVGCGSHETPQVALMTAVVRGDVLAVQNLLDDPRVDLDWTGPRGGDSALIVAAADGKLPIVRLLLQRGANPNVAGGDTYTPLQAAARNGYAEVAQLLIDAGADVNAASGRYGYTPLAGAARYGHVEVIKLLLDAGADRETRVDDGRTALQLAQKYGHKDAANVLMSYRPSRGTQ